MIDVAGGGGKHDLSLDGALSGSLFKSVNSVPGDEGFSFTTYVQTQFTVGDLYAASGPGAQYFAGSVKCLGAMNAPASDTFVTKFNKWKQARFG